MSCWSFCWLIDSFIPPSDYKSYLFSTVQQCTVIEWNQSIDAIHCHWNKYSWIIKKHPYVQWRCFAFLWSFLSFSLSLSSHFLGRLPQKEMKYIKQNKKKRRTWTQAIPWWWILTDISYIRFFVLSLGIVIVTITITTSIRCSR